MAPKRPVPRRCPRLTRVVEEQANRERLEAHSCDDACCPQRPSNRCTSLRPAPNWCAWACVCVYQTALCAYLVNVMRPRASPGCRSRRPAHTQHYGAHVVRDARLGAASSMTSAKRNDSPNVLRCAAAPSMVNMRRNYPCIDCLHRSTHTYLRTVRRNRALMMCNITPSSCE